METVKTFKDIEKEETREREALNLFAELYNKAISLNSRELEFIKESANVDNVETGKDIETMMEDQSNEGLIGGIVGGIGGLAFGSKIGAAICKALGITQGPLYNLMTSKIMTTAICTYLGVKA
jgi:hypothetical protein